ncbi:helix-turn-helix domain-containing protein [Solwaraspora sp. WMMA2080]|uniref:helix-turn-helix domain-containing protein n=1 Tax=unclassified Solwaraspora TaxID=2627926 RepID=UPI00248B95FC|nr:MULTISPECIES: helix-turn-helix domain-containing protein [unclassified Solwaraspora]WBB97536.1 helix-turn-helix domain-containing protein [Solwaraspora sp. WMMA2059]WBC18571.1 helix-turn-helix domain-containing protein [Solwaraspora sp. WMMA2080]
MSVVVGRRVALWRVRRRMTQQVLADRIGRSKSWVEKVERGVRTLDRFSLIQQVADVLRVDPTELLGDTGQPQSGSAVVGVDAVRAALARYEVFAAGPAGPAPDAGEVSQRVAHAWSTYRHGDHPRLLRTVPELLDATRRLHSARPEHGTGLLVQAYRVTSLVLVKIGEADLAWLAADRALATAGSDPILAGSAAVPLAQALRGLSQSRLAMTTAIDAAERVAASTDGQARPGSRAVYGTLLLQAGLAAAGCGDTANASELLGRATHVAGQVGDGQDYRTASFSPAAVELAHTSTSATSRRRDGGWSRRTASHRLKSAPDLPPVPSWLRFPATDRRSPASPGWRRRSG